MCFSPSVSFQVVSTERGRQLAKELGNVRYVEVSALDDRNVQEAFLLLVDEVQSSEHSPATAAPNADPRVRRLDAGDAEEKATPCCSMM
jgi:hypothetical protein